MNPSLSSKALRPPFLRTEIWGEGEREGARFSVGFDQGKICDLKGRVRAAEVPTAAVYVRASPGGEHDLKKEVRKLTCWSLSRSLLS